MKNVKIFLCIMLAALTFSAAAANIEFVDEEDYEGAGQTFTMLDLRPYANRAFADDVAGDGKGGWGDGGPDNDLRDFKLRGEQTLRGVKFNIIEPADNNNCSAIVLRGQNDASVPASVEIAVNQKAAGVYFLHAGSWLSERVGQYVFVYADGSEEAEEIVGGRDMTDWWGMAETETLRTAWKGTAAAAGMISLGLFALPNPNPDKEIAKLRLQTYGDASYAMIVAITLTDRGPYLPKIKKTDKFNPDTGDWFVYEYPRNYEKITGSAMDASFLLDAPCGKHGFGKAVGDSIVFEDGTRERFWGVNIDGAMIYPPYRQAEYTAEILAQRGVNLVRLHMYDVPHAERNIFGYNADIGNTQKLDKEMLDRFHYMIYQLKIRGIYAFLDVCAGRQVFENDNIRDYKTLSDGLKSAVYYDEHLRNLQKRTTEQLMTAVNPYTGSATTEEPTILVVNMNNESTIFNDNFSSDYYRGNIEKKYNAWLADRYKTREKLKEAWGKGLAEGESFSNGSVKIYGANERALISGQRYEDNIHFLCDVLSEYTKDMTEHYRSIGGKQAVSIGTVWGNHLISYAKGIEETEVVDYHAYFLHPTAMYSITKGLKLPGEPVSWITAGRTGIMGRFAATRIKGKPYTISEWNSCEPNPYLSDTPLLMAAYCGMQGWNPMQYTMSSDCLSVDFRNSFKPVVMKNVFTGPDSPQVFDLMPAAAIAYHSVTEADGGYYKPMNEKNFYEAGNQSGTASNDTYLIAKTGVEDKGAGMELTGMENLTLAAEKYSRENNAPYVSLTGELYMDKQNGIFKMNTANSQTAAGFLRGEVIELDDISIKTDTEYASIALSSVTKDTICKSDRLLFSASARARKTGMKLSNDGTEIIESGEAPTLAEPVRGEFVLKTDAEIEVYALSSQGERISRVAASRIPEGVRFTLKGTEKAINFEIVKKGGKRPKNPKIDFGVYKDKPLFGDVNEENREEIERVYLEDVMRKTGENTFSPNAPVTRGDFISALTAAAGIYGNDAEAFDDVSGGMSCFEAVKIARANGIVFGKSDNKFEPDKPITSGEANTMLGRAGISEYRFEGKFVSRLDTAAVMYKIIVK